MAMKINVGKIKNTIVDKTKNITHSVQENSLFHKAKNALYEEGLLSKARNQSVEKMKVYRTDLLNDVNVVNKMNKIPKEQSSKIESSVREASKNVLQGKNSKKGKTSSPWMNATNEEQQAVDMAAQAKVYAKNRASTQPNISQYEEEYAGALLASKARANTYVAQGVLGGYYVDPIKDGRYGVAAARIGVTAGGVGATAIAGNAFGGSSSNYKDNSGSKKY